MFWFLLAGCLGAPSLTVHAPADWVRGPVEIRVETSGSWAEVEVSGQIQPVEGGTIQLDGLPDGTHNVLVRAGGPLRKPRTVHTQVRIDNSPPIVELSTRSHSVEQGHTLPFVVRTDEPATLELRFDERIRPLYPIGQNTWRALIGVPIRHEPGVVQAYLRATDSLGNTIEHEVPVQINPAEWPFTGTLKLSKKKASVPKPAILKMRGERDPVYAEHTDTALWSGLMLLPTQGRHTSFFGSYREYPDGHRSHHDAQDIANRAGTPVHAANAGVVRIARKQAVHGNAILLSHGQGVVTLYSHLRTLKVVEGDTVQAGQLIGEMGSTGRSTGPHLHWGIVVDHIPVDPMQWTEQRFDAAAFDTFEALQKSKPNKK